MAASLPAELYMPLLVTVSLLRGSSLSAPTGGSSGGCAEPAAESPVGLPKDSVWGRDVRRAGPLQVALARRLKRLKAAASTRANWLVISRLMAHIRDNARLEPSGRK